MRPTLRATDQPTAIRVLGFSSIMSTALAMTAAVAHLMELPAKRRYEGRLTVTLLEEGHRGQTPLGQGETARHGSDRAA